MGTRHLICAVIDGEMKLAQYGQWDGYPSVQGQAVVDFLKKLNGDEMETLSKHLRLCSFVSDEEANESKEIQFLRDTSATVLDMILDQPLKLYNSISFAADSLFCEWAYVINFDTNKFEVYTGFNKNPVNNQRFSYLNYNHDARPDRKKEYYPVKLVALYSLDSLPDNLSAEIDTLSTVREVFVD